MCYVGTGIIASKRCDNLKIYDNIVRDGNEKGEGVGIYLHRSSDNAEVYGELPHHDACAGISVIFPICCTRFSSIAGFLWIIWE